MVILPATGVFSSSSIGCYGGLQSAAVTCWGTNEVTRLRSSRCGQAERERRYTRRMQLNTASFISEEDVEKKTAAILAEEEEETAPLVHTPKGADVKGQKQRKQPFYRTIWQFSRPHTLIGSAVAVPTISLFAAPAGANLLTWNFILPILYATLPALLINIYITGLNQITDIEIDRVNKPNLPIVAGNLSKPAAVATVCACLAAGLTLGFWPTPLTSLALQATLVASAVIGTLYSLWPFRLKRFPLFAAICILSVRGSVINTGFYAHVRQASFGIMEGSTLSSLAMVPFRDLKCGLMTAYFALFGIVIALMKDVPDVEGDRIFKISSFSVRFGQDFVFRLSRRLMTTILWGTAGGMIWAARDAYNAALLPLAGGRAVLGGAAIIAGQILRSRGGRVKTDDQQEVASYYMMLWKIFYASYLFLPLAR